MFSIDNEKRSGCINPDSKSTFPSEYLASIYSILEFGVSLLRNDYDIQLSSNRHGGTIARTRFRIIRRMKAPKLQITINQYPLLSYLLPNPRYLLKPSISGCHHIFGLCHEIGHLSLWLIDSSTRAPYMELNEAIADFVSLRIIEKLWATVGYTAWPDNYAYIDEDTVPKHKLINGCTGVMATPCLAESGIRPYTKLLISPILSSPMKDSIMKCIARTRLSKPIYVNGFRAYDLRTFCEESFPLLQKILAL